MNLNIDTLKGSVDDPITPDASIVDGESVLNEDGTPTEGIPAVEEIPGTEQTKLISDKVQELLIAQIGHEMFAHYEYTAIAAYFSTIGLEGFAAWATKQSCDEVGHARKVICFLIELDISPELPPIEGASAKFENVAAAVAAIMMREKSVTENWKAIGVQAMTDQDLATLNLAQCFISEQIEEENLVRTILQRVEMAEGGTGILVIDGQLAEEYGE